MRRWAAILLLAAVLAVAGGTRSSAAFAPYHTLWQVAQRAVDGRTGESPEQAAARLWAEEAAALSWDLDQDAPQEHPNLTWEMVRDADSFVVLPTVSLGNDPTPGVEGLVAAFRSKGEYRVLARWRGTPVGEMELDYEDGAYHLNMIGGCDGARVVWQALHRAGTLDPHALFAYVLMEDYIVHTDSALTLALYGAATLMSEEAVADGSVAWAALAAALRAEFDSAAQHPGVIGGGGVGQGDTGDSPVWGGPALAGCLGGILLLSVASTVRRVAGSRGGRRNNVHTFPTA